MKVRPVRIGVHRVGATADDVRTLQADISSAQVNISAAVDACKDALPQSSKDAWYVLAKQCIRFVSKEPVFGTVDAMAADGAVLKAQLDAWRTTLIAAGCPVSSFDWSQAPVNRPTGTGDPLGDIFKNVEGLALVALAFLLLGKSGR